MDKILTVNNVAEILQVKAITVREMFREKRLRGFKVGKSWRTTESMLQEDIDALARGESPAELPMPSTPPAKPKPAPAPIPPKSTEPVPPPKPQPPKSNEPVPAPKPQPPRKPDPAREKEGEDDDTQQMLF